MADVAIYDPKTSPKLGATLVVGEPLTRLDSKSKVTGSATYAAEHPTDPPAAYGFIVEATIASGRILAIDTKAAEQAPGVRLVMTHRNAPHQAPPDPPVIPNRLTRARPVLFDANVRFFGEPIALVVADSFEQARAAAAMVEARYSPAAATFVLADNLAHSYRPERVGGGYAPDSQMGDLAAAFAAAPAKIDARYDCARQNHNPMEPHAALAWWDGDAVRAYVSAQNLAAARASLARTLQVPADKVRLLSRFVGGGFGSKLPINAEAVLAVLASRVLGRPVKVVQTRQQMFANTGHRPAFRHRVRLAAQRDGRLTAVALESWGETARFEEFAEQAATCARSLYAAPNRLTRHRLVPLDVQHGETMRAPGEAPGLLVFESAMDELAHTLGMDPVDLRLANEPRLDPELGVPFASRRLADCLREGTRRFGWSERPKIPGTRREGRQLIGFGVAAGIRPNKIATSSARARLREDGSVSVALDMTDIGTGSFTILTQIAADAMGLQPDAIEIVMGDSDLPATTGSGGSLGAGSAGAALFNACVNLRQAVAQAAAADPASALQGLPPHEMTFRSGHVLHGNVSESYADIARRAKPGMLSADGTVEPGDSYKRYAQYSFAAYFVEAQVDRDTAEVRVRRMLGVFDAGRILNAKTARSQLIGGMIWGMSAALHEEGVIDPRYGNYVGRDLAGYHFPAHADIPAIEALTVGTADENSNPLGSKGLGELGICGSGAAVANAVFSATGVRVRSFPVTLDKLLPWLPG